MEAGSSELTEPSHGNKMEDTVTLARHDREKQGPSEAEVTYGGEADLHQHFKCCDKNPGHRNFIHVDQFNVDHLPPGCHDNEVVDFVRAMSDPTVRVSVKYVSDSRPETVPRSDKPFPCYKDRGRDMMRTGTGFVKYVDICPELYETCNCKKCVNSPTPKTQFARIYIETAAHVIYDDLEAAHTTCHLFFDKGKSPAVCSGVVTLSGFSIVYCELDRDCCLVRCTTHDLDLADRVNMMFKQFTLLGYDMADRFNMDKSLDRNLPSEQLLQLSKVNHNNSDNILTIIVSHPHGCSKQVSIGRFIHLERREDGPKKCMYTTPTFPGSSGAHVGVLSEKGTYLVLGGYVHSGGHCEGFRQLNFSASGKYIF